MDDEPYAEYVFPRRPREIAEPFDGRDRWFLKFADMQPEEVARGTETGTWLVLTPREARADSRNAGRGV
jgi:hypothetical protein